MNVGCSPSPVRTAIGGPSAPAAPGSRNDASGRVRNRGPRSVAIVVGVEVRAGQCAIEHSSVARRRVAAQAEQQQVARLVRVERGLGVPRERHDEEVESCRPSVRGRGHDVLDEAAAVLLHVADGFAEEPSDGEQISSLARSLPVQRLGSSGVAGTVPIGSPRSRACRRVPESGRNAATAVRSGAGRSLASRGGRVDEGFVERDPVRGPEGGVRGWEACDRRTSLALQVTRHWSDFRPIAPGS